MLNGGFGGVDVGRTADRRYTLTHALVGRARRKKGTFMRKFTALAVFSSVLMTGIQPWAAETRPEVSVVVQSIGVPSAIVETIATTLDHLRDSLPDTAFVFEHVDRDELVARLDAATPSTLFITDAVTFSEWEREGRAVAVASMKNPRALDAAHTTGAAFIVRSDRTDLTSVASLKDRRLEATGRSAYESYLIGMHEIRRIFGKEPFFSEEVFSGPPSEQVVHDVVAGKADVGVVEACLLETMEVQGNIRPGELRVLGERRSRDLQCRHSTELYPGWVMGLTAAVMPPSTEARRFARDVAQALASVPRVGSTFEWAPPPETESLKSLIADLPVVGTAADLRAFVRAYGPYAAAAAAFILAMVLHSIYVGYLVRRRTAELERAVTEKEELRERVDEEKERMATLERAGIAGQLSGMIAHELTQPLSSIVNYARGLRIRLKRGTLAPDVLEEALGKIAEQGMSASEIVNRVRGYAKNGATEESVLDLGAVLREAVRRFRAIRPDAPEPEVSAEDGVLVEGREMEIRLLIHNLLKNADEASRKSIGPRIWVSVTGHGRTAKLTVTDNGPEVSSGALEKMFEPLRTTKAGGLGLGLAICRGIAEAHGGSIRAEKDPQGRLSFVLELPRLAGAPNPSAALDFEGREGESS